MNAFPISEERWFGGRLMAFTALDGPTDYEHGLTARTLSAPAGLEIVAPGNCRILFSDEPAREVIFAGDFFRFTGASGETRGVLLDAHHLLIQGPCRVENIDPGVRSVAKDGRTLVGAGARFSPELIGADLDSAWKERSRWLSAQSVPAGSAATQRAMQHALSFMKIHVCSPEGLIRRRWTTPDRWPHKDMWLWDSAFHAIGWRHVDPALAQEMLDAVFDGQRPDGFIPLRASPLRIEPVMTQPPVLAYGALQVAEKTGDWDWIARVYPKLCAYVEWDLANRDADGDGLAEWYLEEHEHCRSGESGMDNSPRFDAGGQLAAVDFNSFLALECETLAGFAFKLGKNEESKTWSLRHRKLCRLINEHLWSEEHHFYCDYDPATRRRTPVIASAGFLPLLCGAATAERARWLAMHLSDPDMFATAVPVPSIAVRDRKHYAKDMFRGPTWVNVNWLIAAGFTRNGMKDHAREIRDSTIREIERTVEQFGVFFEYFDDRRELDPPKLLRKGKCDPQASPYHQVIHDFGWTTTLYADWIFTTEKP